MPPGPGFHLGGGTLVALACAVALSPLSRGPQAAPRFRAGAPRGTIHLDGRAFSDANGPHLAVGASLFWAVWGYRHDRARLEAHFRYLSEQGVDYVRVLGVVGPEGWTDRTADPTEAGYQQTVAGVTDLAFRFGLRVEWTIFGSVDRTRSPQRRRQVVEQFAGMASGREAKIQHWEIANEAWATGWRGREAEARDLARLLQARVPQPVAVTAEDCGTQYYRGGAGTIRTAHLNRDITAAGGRWAPVLQAWNMSSCPEPKAWTSNEPIGPGSSVASDDSPVRLAMAAATTWLSGGAGYVLHTRPGVRGGGKEDMEKYGGPASLWEIPRLTDIMTAIRSVRGLLPPDLPNWRRDECSSDTAERPFECAGPLRTYCAWREREVVCLPLALQSAARLTARFDIVGEWFDPVTGRQLGHFDLKKGEAVRLGDEAAYVVRGRRSSHAEPVEPHR